VNNLKWKQQQYSNHFLKRKFLIASYDASLIKEKQISEALVPAISNEICSIG